MLFLIIIIFSVQVPDLFKPFVLFHPFPKPASLTYLSYSLQRTDCLWGKTIRILKNLLCSLYSIQQFSRASQILPNVSGMK